MDIWPSGFKTICLFRWKPIGFHWKYMLLLWPWQRSIWSGLCMLGSSPIGVSTFMMKIFQTQRQQFMPLSKVSKCENFDDHGNIENKVRSNICHATKGLLIMHLGYKYQVSNLNDYWFMDICLSHWLQCENWTLTHKIQNWGCSYQSFVMPFITLRLR